MADVTQTKRKAILREMSGHEGSVTYFRLMQLASRHQLSVIAIRNLLTQAAYVCEPPLQRDQPTPVTPRPRVEKPKSPLTPEERALIRSGRLYRLLAEDSDIVIIRRTQFEMERERIIKLLNAFHD